MPGYEFAFVEVVVTDGLAGCDPALEGRYRRGRVAQLADARAFRTGLRVGEVADLPRGAYTVRATLHRTPTDPGAAPDSGAVLVRRCLAIAITGSRVVRVRLDSDCVAIECPAPSGSAAFTECLAGRCVDPQCDPADPSTYEAFCCDRRDSRVDCDAARFCLQDSDCEPIAACASVRCDIQDGATAGVCVSDEDTPGVCGAGTFCQRETGTCAPIPATDVDAGTLADASIDAASAIDASVDATVDATRDAFVPPDASGVCLDPAAYFTADGCVLRDVSVCSAFSPCPADYACQRVSDGTDRCVCSSPTTCGLTCTSSAECAVGDPARPMCRRGACYPDFDCLTWWDAPIFCAADEMCAGGCVPATATGTSAAGAMCATGSECLSGNCVLFTGFPSRVCVETCTTTADCSVGPCVANNGAQPICYPPASAPSGCEACTTAENCAIAPGTAPRCLRPCRQTGECSTGEVCRIPRDPRYGHCSVAPAASCRMDELMIEVEGAQACSTTIPCVDDLDCSGDYTCQAWVYGLRPMGRFIATCARPPG